MDHVSAILMACARLHNVFIRDKRPFHRRYESVQKEMDNLEITPQKNAPFGMSYLPVIPDDDFEIYDGVSYMREAIVQAICEYDIYWSTRNIECRKREIHEQSLK